MEFLIAIFAMFGAHYVADFAMQNQYVADAKADTKRPDWFHALTAHAFHHAVTAGIALALLGLPWFGGAIAIGVTHWWIDYGKSVKNWYGYHSDQTQHLVIAAITGITATVLA